MNAGRLDAIEARHGDWYGQTGAGVWADLHGEWADMRADTVEQQVMARQIVRNDVPALVAALRAVLAEHHRAVAYGVAVCDTCSQVKDEDEWDDPNDSPIASWLPWPCPTVRAVTEALGGTP